MVSQYRGDNYARDALVAVTDAMPQLRWECAPGTSTEGKRSDYQGKSMICSHVPWRTGTLFEMDWVKHQVSPHFRYESAGGEGNIPMFSHYEKSRLLLLHSLSSAFDSTRVGNYLYNFVKHLTWCIRRSYFDSRKPCLLQSKIRSRCVVCDSPSTFRFTRFWRRLRGKCYPHVVSWSGLALGAIDDGETSLSCYVDSLLSLLVGYPPRLVTLPRQFLLLFRPLLLSSQHA